MNYGVRSWSLIWNLAFDLFLGEWEWLLTTSTPATQPLHAPISQMFLKVPDGTLTSRQLAWKSQLWLHRGLGTWRFLQISRNLPTSKDQYQLSSNCAFQQVIFVIWCWRHIARACVSSMQPLSQAHSSGSSSFNPPRRNLAVILKYQNTLSPMFLLFHFQCPILS